MRIPKALVLNPECLVVHKPALVFDETQAKKVLRIIREHVDNRGVELPREGRKQRRPRTVLLDVSKLGASLGDYSSQTKF